MGIILDSSIVIDAERTGETPSELIARLALEFDDQPMAQTAIGYTELHSLSIAAPISAGS